MRATLFLAVISILTSAAIVSPARAEPPEGAGVTGFGGFFFRAEDPKALAKWYTENLGIAPVPQTYEAPVWTQSAGPTVFSPVSKDAAYYGAPEQAFMFNFRTENLDGLVAHLRANGAEVEVDPQTYPNGRFARTADPEGNPIQLWQPASPPQSSAPDTE